MWGRRCWYGWWCQGIVGINSLGDLIKICHTTYYYLIYSCLEEKEKRGWSWRAKKGLYYICWYQKINGVLEWAKWSVYVS